MIHTPFPWVFRRETVSAAGHYQAPAIWSEHDSNNPRIIATLATRREATANGRLIVEAVTDYAALERSHAELLEALKQAEIALMNCVPVVPYKGDGPLVSLRAAIRRAEEVGK
jgi:hypothetical protein